MAFYVRLGPRGILFRIGTALIGLIGSTIYRRGHRRRRRRDVRSSGLRNILPAIPPISTTP